MSIPLAGIRLLLNAFYKLALIPMWRIKMEIGLWLSGLEQVY
jgi:hypothetical protein